jgi:hypothetical protein
VTIRSWSDEDLRGAVAASASWSQVARALGLKANGGGSSKLMHSAAVTLGLDTSHFLTGGWNRGTGNGRDPVKARAGKQRWYENNRHVYRAANQRRYVEKRRKIAALKSVPCADCGNRFPYFVMDFDHRDGEEKLGNISSVVFAWSWKRLLAEIAKCDVVCANCHRIRTARRGGWSGHDLLDSGWDMGVPAGL